MVASGRTSVEDGDEDFDYRIGRPIRRATSPADPWGPPSLAAAGRGKKGHKKAPKPPTPGSIKRRTSLTNSIRSVRSARLRSRDRLETNRDVYGVQAQTEFRTRYRVVSPHQPRQEKRKMSEESIRPDTRDSQTSQASALRSFAIATQISPGVGKSASAGTPETGRIGSRSSRSSSGGSNGSRKQIFSASETPKLTGTVATPPQRRPSRSDSVNSRSSFRRSKAELGLDDDAYHLQDLCRLLDKSTRAEYEQVRSSLRDNVSKDDKVLLEILDACSCDWESDLPHARRRLLGGLKGLGYDVDLWHLRLNGIGTRRLPQAA